MDTTKKLGYIRVDVDNTPDSLCSAFKGLNMILAILATIFCDLFSLSIAQNLGNNTRQLDEFAVGSVSQTR